jgi:hypothetical protein
MKFLGIKDVDLAKNPLIPFVPYRWSVMRDGEDTIISRYHYEAAEAYVKLRTEYLRAIKAPLPSVGGGVDPDPDATDSYYVEKCERVRKTYDGIRRELLDQGLFSVVQIIAVDNEDRRQWAGKFRVAMNLVHKLLIGRVDT